MSVFIGPSANAAASSSRRASPPLPPLPKNHDESLNTDQNVRELLIDECVQRKICERTTQLGNEELVQLLMMDGVRKANASIMIAAPPMLVGPPSNNAGMGAMARMVATMRRVAPWLYKLSKHSARKIIFQSAFQALILGQLMQKNPEIVTSFQQDYQSIGTGPSGEVPAPVLVGQMYDLFYNQPLYLASGLLGAGGTIAATAVGIRKRQKWFEKFRKPPPKGEQPNHDAGLGSHPDSGMGLDAEEAPDGYFHEPISGDPRTDGRSYAHGDVYHSLACIFTTPSEDNYEEIAAMIREDVTKFHAIVKETGSIPESLAPMLPVPKEEWYTIDEEGLLESDYVYTDTMVLAFTVFYNIQVFFWLPGYQWVPKDAYIMCLNEAYTSLRLHTMFQDTKHLENGRIRLHNGKF
jgi:hypothetical protein